MEENLLKDKENLELERVAMALEASMCRLSELEKKQRNTRGETGEAQQENKSVLFKGGPAQMESFGSNIEDLFDHSYQRPRIHRWMWVPHSRVLEAAQIRFPASEEAVRRFGATAKHIKSVKAKTTDSRSFVEVTAGGKMDN